MTVFIILLAALLSSDAPPATNDAVVYGATSAGVAAAVQAKCIASALTPIRRGRFVIASEPRALF
ncbi:MAG: hypothetical protein EHM13_08660 [Acidobacteria bacterium]|nr:MAG: hypothetical protein EHM13_08660 [Acidobacteriota bacterium]